MCVCRVLGGPWPIKAAMDSRASAISLEVWLRKTMLRVTICMFHEHYEIKSCFGSKHFSIFSDLSVLATIYLYMCVYMLKYTFLNVLFFSELFNNIFAIIVVL